MKLRCIIVDDEPSGRKVMRELVEETPFLELVGEAENPVRALALLTEGAVDLMFLDIQMPRMNGIDFLKSLRRPPLVVLTTAYPEYALQGYELDVMDYLLKPVSYERFLKAATKAQDYSALLREPGGSKAARDYFFIKCDAVYEKIRFDDILYVESLNNFVSIHTTGRRYLTWLTAKAVEDALPAGRFLRVHRSYLVAVARVERIAGNEICVGGQLLPLSRSLRAEVLERLLNDRLLQR